MKKRRVRLRIMCLLSFLFCFLFAMSAITMKAQGQIWHTADSVSLGWDAVPGIANDVIRYRVYIKQEPGGTEQEMTSGEGIIETQSLITFTQEGRWFMGVQSARWVENGLVGTSSISWSSDPAVCANNEAFGAIYFLPPAAVGGLKFTRFKDVEKFLKENRGFYFLLLYESKKLIWVYYGEKMQVIYPMFRSTHIQV